MKHMYFTASALWVKRGEKEFKVLRISNEKTGEVLYERNFTDLGERYFIDC